MNQPEQKILIVEDEILQRQMLESLVRRKIGLSCLSASNGREAIALMAQSQGAHIALIILDMNMPVMGGMETLKVLRQRYAHIPVIVVTGNSSLNDAVEAMKAGATDFIVKPYQGERIAAIIQSSLKLGNLSKRISRLEAHTSAGAGFRAIIGHDRGLSHCITVGRKAAAAEIPVLITGATGSGKEVFARAIYTESRRTGKPFIAVNCGAIPSQLVESALFGHEKGAFTGATEKMRGKFREADGGTIFLDEVGELPLEAQVKLLRVLQQSEVEPVGAAHPVVVDVRVISATNRDLAQEVEKGRFREDLYFRLNVLHINLPDMESRKEDIPMLAQHFIARFCALEGIENIELSPQTLSALQSREWPGNVRELENAINRALVMRESDVLYPEDFQNVPLQNNVQEKKPSVGNSDDFLSLIDSTGVFKTMEAIEREAMQAALAKCGGNVTQAAKILGIAKSTFYRKMEQR